MKKIIGRDSKGRFLRIGDNVIMPDPRPSDDAWKYGNFTARIESDKLIGHKMLVIDQEDNAWNVEPERVQLDGVEYPIYGADEKDMPDGLYIGLFHGYPDEEGREKAGDWGENGALIGPVRFVQTTYATLIKFNFVNPKDSEKYGLPSEVITELPYKDDCVLFDGMYYGDWTVFNIKNGEVA